jgi:hypothetical protein
MTRDDITRMAREAGAYPAANTDRALLLLSESHLERFAALVAAAEREKVAAWMIERSYATGHGDTIEDLLKELEWQIREAEREACARVCESMSLEWEDQPAIAQAELATLMDCALAIRSRSNP